jgi:hypothetical protein
MKLNPSITNPTLLRVGDVITLFGKERVRDVASLERKPAPKSPKTEHVLKGIDLADSLDLDSLGYFSLVEVAPLGRIEAFAATRLVVSNGDEVFVHFRSRQGVKIGEPLAIAKISEPIRHPITNKPFGYVVSVRGSLTVKEYVQDGLYLAQVGKTFAEVEIDDVVIPRQPVGACILPRPTDPKLYGNIVAVEENRLTIGRHTIVYLDGGFKDGIHQGSVFDVVRLHRKPVLDFKRYPMEDISKEVVTALGKETYLEDFMRELTEGKKIYESSVGKLIVIESRPDTAVGVVLVGKEELARGAFVKGMPWVEPPDFIASLSTCIVK